MSNKDSMILAAAAVVYVATTSNAPINKIKQILKDKLKSLV